MCISELLTTSLRGGSHNLFVGSHVVATHYVTVKFPYVGFMSAKSHS